MLILHVHKCTLELYYSDNAGSVFFPFSLLLPAWFFFLFMRNLLRTFLVWIHFIWVANMLFGCFYLIHLFRSLWNKFVLSFLPLASWQIRVSKAWIIFNSFCVLSRDQTKKASNTFERQRYTKFKSTPWTQAPIDANMCVSGRTRRFPIPSFFSVAIFTLCQIISLNTLRRVCVCVCGSVTIVVNAVCRFSFGSRFVLPSSYCSLVRASKAVRLCNARGEHTESCLFAIMLLIFSHSYLPACV